MESLPRTYHVTALCMNGNVFVMIDLCYSSHNLCLFPNTRGMLTSIACCQHTGWHNDRVLFVRFATKLFTRLLNQLNLLSKSNKPFWSEMEHTKDVPFRVIGWVQKKWSKGHHKKSYTVGTNHQKEWKPSRFKKCKSSLNGAALVSSVCI